MPTIIATDIIDTLNHFHSLLMKSPDPHPLGACDAQDIRRAAVVIARMREREVEAERELLRLRAENARLRGMVQGDLS